MQTPVSVDKPLKIKNSIHQVQRELDDLKVALQESVIVAITDKNGVILEVNEPFCRLSKYSRKELIGKTHRIIRSEHHPTEFFQKMWSTISQGKVWRGDIKNRAKDGTYYWVATTIVPFLDEHGAPYQYIAVRKDITEQKLLELRMADMNKILEASVAERTQALMQVNVLLTLTLTKLKENERLRETFIAALTHDLRTPLVAQSRALQIFQNQRYQLPEKLAPLTEQLIKSNDDLLDMVNKLLEIYQYEAGQVDLVVQSVNLNQLVQECIAEMKLLAEHKQIKIENKLPNNLSPIHGDYQQIKRLFTNLIGNALEHIDQEATVTIDDDDLDNEVVIRIQDTGQGIPEALITHLFNHFFVIQQPHKKIGSGLGLSICKLIMDLHGGTINVTNTQYSGALFTLTFPKNPMRKP